MEKLTINLDEYQKISRSGKIFNIILGSVLIFFPGVVIYKRISEGHDFGDYLFFLLLFILGLYILLFTFGIFYRITRRYVEVDDHGIEYKLSYFYPARSIPWEIMKKVEIRTLRIFFHTEGGSFKMKLGEIFYSDIQILKQTLASVCSKKGIECSDTTVESDLAGSK